jgi:hypothetical protein
MIRLLRSAVLLCVFALVSACGDKTAPSTTTYVRNIYKYYVAYKLALQARETQRKAREQVAPAAQP